MTRAAMLVLEDGDGLRGRVGRRAGRRVRRGRLHDGDDRLPGDRHRPELRGADRLLHRADGRQLRRRPSALRVERGRTRARSLMREARGPEWTDWLHEHGVVALTGVDTRSLVLHLRERGAMRAAVVAAATSTSTRCSRRCARSRRWPARRSSRASRRSEPYTFSDRRRACASRSSTTAASARSCAGSRANGAAVDVFPHDVDADTLAAYDGVLLSTGPGRSGAARRRDATRAGAARPRAGARRLPRSPAARARDRPRDVQAAVRPPRREPSRCSTARTRPRARHVAEPRLRGRAPSDEPDVTHSSLYDGTVEGLAYPELRARSAQFHPEAAPGPARRVADHRGAGSRS